MSAMRAVGARTGRLANLGLGRWRRRIGRKGLAILAALVVLGFVVALALPTLTGSGSGSVETPAAPSQTTNIQQAVEALTRTGIGPGDVNIDAVYAPPLLLEGLGEGPVSEGSLVFFAMESIHEDTFLTPPPEVYLQIDGEGRYDVSEVKPTQSDIHHRTTKYVFSVPDAVGGTLLDGSPHILSLIAPTDDGLVTKANSFEWELPGDLSRVDGLAESAAPTADLDSPQVSLNALTKALRRIKKGVAYEGAGGIELAATYATPEYFETALPPKAAVQYTPELAAVFVVSETIHTSELPDVDPPLTLVLDGKGYEPGLVRKTVSSPHHRVSMVRFPVNPAEARLGEVMELQLPDGSSLSWRLPIAYSGRSGASPFGVPWASFLAVLAGMVAAMWPCLFQLTVFFIPTLAGLSMQEAGGDVTLVKRMAVVKAALFFVLGFTLVYTAAGAMLGFVAGRFGESIDFEQWQRYLSIVGGILILLLALRAAARVRAPLVCKMPLLGKVGRRRQRAANPLELMLAGLAFATGCMACFGAAMVIAMVVYVGVSGSAAFGAFALFMFSLGMGVPLVIAAAAMAKALPLLFRLERALPWIGLTSSVVMVGFAILLITGNYMALTEWVSRAMPGIGTG